MNKMVCCHFKDRHQDAGEAIQALQQIKQGYLPTQTVPPDSNPCSFEEGSVKSPQPNPPITSSQTLTIITSHPSSSTQTPRNWFIPVMASAVVIATGILTVAIILLWSNFGRFWITLA